MNSTCCAAQDAEAAQRLQKPAPPNICSPLTARLKHRFKSSFSLFIFGGETFSLISFCRVVEKTAQLRVRNFAFGLRRSETENEWKISIFSTGELFSGGAEQNRKVKRMQVHADKVTTG